MCTNSITESATICTAIAARSMPATRARRITPIGRTIVCKIPAKRNARSVPRSATARPSTTLNHSPAPFASLKKTIVATIVLLWYQRRIIRSTGSVAIMADNVHYQSDVLLNGSVIVAMVLDQYFGWQFEQLRYRLPLGVAMQLRLMA